MQGDRGQSDDEGERDTEREWRELTDMKDLRNGEVQKVRDERLKKNTRAKRIFLRQEYLKSFKL